MATEYQPSKDRQASFQLNSPLHHQRPYSLPVSLGSAVPGETPAFRNAKVIKDLHTVPENGVHTVKDIVRRAATKFGDNPAIGFRTEIRTHAKEGPEDADGNKKQLVISELSSYKFLSYIEYDKLVTNIGCGLVKAGLLPTQDKICMWAQTRLVDFISIHLELARW
jgi:long-chain acyl-CoA synthetase